MSRNNGKLDRMSQMENQKTVIEKKKLEIIEKQRNKLLVKAIHENMKTIKADKSEIDEAVQDNKSSTSIFSNDGSFLEQFMKMEKMAKKNLQIESRTAPVEIGSVSLVASALNPVEQANLKDTVSDQNLAGFASDTSPSDFNRPDISQQINPIQVYLEQPSISVNLSSANFIGTNSLPPLSRISTVYPMFNPNIPPPLSSLSDHSIMKQQQQPHQQQQRFLPPLSTIPPPKPIELNKIPAPKELDLNAIPKPVLNLDQIKVPESAATQSKVFSDNELMPTSIEQLIELVAEIGDIYEEKLLSRKNDLQPSIWFLTNKDSNTYKTYRHFVLERRLKGTATTSQPKDDSTTKYDPADVLENDDDCFEVEVKEEKIVRPNIEDDTSSDSDTEYMKEAKERNLRNIKRKAADSHLRRNDTSDSEEEEYDIQRKPFFHGKRDSELSSDSQTKTNRSRLKRSRWGVSVPPPATATNTSPPPLSTPTVVMPFQAPINLANNQMKLALKTITRTDPALLAYARLNFGTTDLSEEDWRKAEEHYKINLLYQDLLKKRQEIDRLAKSGKCKYEYDSDEDTTGGTWEHKLRLQEMEATRNWADALTKHSDGRHFLGDFLPPEELKKFMEQYEAKKNNRLPDLSDYREFKLKEDNIGFQMLQKLGWREGQGLGQGGSGIVEPINKASQRQNQGLGTSNADVPEQNDNEYDAYRKRMMLAYRFRPNPLNNPRRAYY